MKRLFLDCDGVLADFNTAMLTHFGMSFAQLKEKVGYDEAWVFLRTSKNRFYRDLPLMPGAIQFYEAVKHLKPTILTGAHEGDGYENDKTDKVEWTAHHFPSVPTIVCLSEEKHLFMSPGDVLVDDRLKYRHLWEAAGGVFVHYQTPDQALKEINRIFYTED
jgi:beta-phosphoglucomutase-like phosphatase (HAD superfamily)